MYLICIEDNCRTTLTSNIYDWHAGWEPNLLVFAQNSIKKSQPSNYIYYNTQYLWIPWPEHEVSKELEWGT